MEPLPIELERALKKSLRLEKCGQAKSPEIYDLVGADRLGCLIDLGYLNRPGSTSSTLSTPMGRSYFRDQRRETRRRWAPVLVSAAIGACGTLLGVIATLLLT